MKDFVDVAIYIDCHAYGVDPTYTPEKMLELIAADKKAGILTISLGDNTDLKNVLPRLLKEAILFDKALKSIWDFWIDGNHECAPFNDKIIEINGWRIFLHHGDVADVGPSLAAERRRHKMGCGLWPLRACKWIGNKWRNAFGWELSQDYIAMIQFFTPKEERIDAVWSGHKHPKTCQVGFAQSTSNGVAYDQEIIVFKRGRYQLRIGANNAK